MCWIAFRKIETLVNMLQTQSTRWMDWVGLLYHESETPILHKIFVTKDYTTWLEWRTGQAEATPYHFTDNRVYSYAKLEEFYQDILALITNKIPNGTFVFAHHRKWTVGSNWIPNTHPFETNKFILAQNGTDKRIHEWWIVEWIDPDRSDTFVLLQYLDMHCNTLEECIVRIKVLLERKILIGTIMIYSKTEKKYLFFADWERSLYIEKNPTGDIEYIQSRQDNTFLDCKTKGYIIVDQHGKILKEELVDTNFPKVEVKTLPPVSYGAGRYPDPYDDYGDYYWGTRGMHNIFWDTKEDMDIGWWWEWSFQDLSPEPEDVADIEENYDYINYMELEDVMEMLMTIDEKKFHKLKSKVRSQTATKEEAHEYVDMVVYSQVCIKRVTDLAEKAMKLLTATTKAIEKQWFDGLWIKPEPKKPNIHLEGRAKAIQDMQLTLMEIQAYKDLFKL